MHVAILGTGEVGQALAAGFRRHGHTVTMGTRDPANGKLDAFAAEHDVRVATFADAAKAGEMAVLCTGWTGTENALRLAEPNNLAGKLVVDVTNPLKFQGDGPPGLDPCGSDSGGEQVQRWLPDSHVVKCWNIVGNPHMIDPDFPDGPPTMFIAGDDGDAKAIMTGLLTDFGWDVSDLGGIQASRYLEPLAMVWILDYFRTGNGDHAVKMLRK
jgi:8-hydroxy-5-deazaflavin:NADPH oxidoreductase